VPQNHENSKVIYFAKLGDMVPEKASTVHVHNPRKQKRKHGGVVVPEREKKEYKFVSKNCRLNVNFESLPYGYY